MKLSQNTRRLKDYLYSKAASTLNIQRTPPLSPPSPLTLSPPFTLYQLLLATHLRTICGSTWLSVLSVAVARLRTQRRSIPLYNLSYRLHRHATPRWPIEFCRISGIYIFCSRKLRSSSSFALILSWFSTPQKALIRVSSLMQIPWLSLIGDHLHDYSPIPQAQCNYKPPRINLARLLFLSLICLSSLGFAQDRIRKE